MSDAVGLDTEKSTSVWDTIDACKDKANKLRIRFLDFVAPHSPVTGSREVHLIPFFVENIVGTYLYPMYVYQSGGSEIPEKYRYYQNVVQKVGQSLAANSPRKGLNFEFTVVNDWELNAWCLPGGKIAVNLGMLQELEKTQRDFGTASLTFEDKVAAVLSHEITHATARHFGRTMEFKIFIAALIKASNSVISYFVNKHYDKKLEKETDKVSRKVVEAQRQSTHLKVRKVFDSVSKFVTSGIGKCNSRKHELEADRYGMFLLKNSGMNAQSAIWLQEFFIYQKPHSSGGFFDWLSSLTSTHPTSQERLAANKQTWKEMTY
jgi:beta-barrel assembly-enhancing protease